MSSRRGFTFIELLVVIAIIAILAGMVLAGLSVLRKMSKTASTWDEMTHITTAMDQYLREFPKLGQTPNDFYKDPWEFFYKQRRRLKQEPLIELHLERLVEKTGSGSSSRPASLLTATHILDHFGATSGNVLSFTLYNANKGGREYAECIILRSSAGTPSEPKDDLIFVFTNDKASWRKIRQQDLVDLGKDLDPVQTIDANWTDPLSY